MFLKILKPEIEKNLFNDENDLISMIMCDEVIEIGNVSFSN